MKSHLLELLNIPFHYSNQIHYKDWGRGGGVLGEEKSKTPNLLNHDYIHCSDLKI